MKIKLPSAKKEKPPLRYPISDDGGCKGYEDWTHDSSKWREAHPFDAVLVLSDCESGRSSITVVLKDVNGATYPMLMYDFMNLLMKGQGEIANGSTYVHGRWIVVKKGANYRLKPYENH